MSTLIDKLPQLRKAANEAMWGAWHDAGLDKGTPREVECIKELVSRALPRVQAQWEGILKPAGIMARLRGVVCHGHPWVNYPKATRRCELGDILLVHDHRPAGSGPLERRAVIVQAKVFHATGVRAKNSVQLELYQRWPRFTYESWPGGIAVLDSLHATKNLKGTKAQRYERELKFAGTGRGAVSTRMLDDGCRYGMIDAEYSRWGDPKAGMNPWRLCSAQAPDVYTSKAGLSLGGYLVRLMAGSVGRVVPDISWPRSLQGACHWSLMVKELMSLLPTSAGGAVGNIAFLAATPNMHVNVPRHSFAKEEDDGAFCVIHVRTMGDRAELLRRADGDPG